jgi:hypothetical protein
MDPVEMRRHGVRRDGLLGPGITPSAARDDDWMARRCSRKTSQNAAPRAGKESA